MWRNPVGQVFYNPAHKNEPPRQIPSFGSEFFERNLRTKVGLLMVGHIMREECVIKHCAPELVV